MQQKENSLINFISSTNFFRDETGRNKSPRKKIAEEGYENSSNKLFNKFFKEQFQINFIKKVYFFS